MRDDGKLMKARMESVVSADALGELWETGIVMAIRRMLHDFAVHEVEECLLVRGERVFDPHVKRERRDEF